MMIFFLALLAFSLSLVCGGGAGLLLIPVLGTALPAAQVPAALSLGTATSSVSRWVLFRRSIRWEIVRSFVPCALPAALAGAALLRFLQPAYLEMLMALFLLSNLPLVLRPRAQDHRGGGLSHRRVAGIGTLTGFVSGLTGAVGLLFNGFYLQGGLSKEEIVATRAANEGLLHLFKLAIYLLMGLLSTQALLVGCSVAVAAAVSTLLMKRALPWIPEGAFRRLGYGAMVLSGCVLLQGSLRTLAADRPALQPSHSRETLSGDPQTSRTLSHTSFGRAGC